MERNIFVKLIITDEPAVDYPSYLPIPNLEDMVVFNEFEGVVKHVRHVTVGSITEIQIRCDRTYCYDKKPCFLDS